MRSIGDPNSTLFHVWTTFDIDYFKSFVNEYKVEPECDWMKPWMEHLKLLSGLDQSRFVFRQQYQDYYAKVTIASNGDQLHLLEQ